jgi:hypothetical protein
VGEPGYYLFLTRNSKPFSSLKSQNLFNWPTVKTLAIICEVMTVDRYHFPPHPHLTYTTTIPVSWIINSLTNRDNKRSPFSDDYLLCM